MIRVLLADDQSLDRAGFRMILSGEPGIEVVGEAGDGIEAVSEARVLAPDVVLMDIRMPGLDGIEATRQIVAGQDPPRIVVLATFDLDEYVYESAPRRARERVPAQGREGAPARGRDPRVVAEGGSLFAPSVTRRLIERFAEQSETAGPPPALERLTSREARGPPPRRRRSLERRDRLPARRQRAHDEDARREHPAEASAEEPGAGGGACL